MYHPMVYRGFFLPLHSTQHISSSKLFGYWGNKHGRQYGATQVVTKNHQSSQFHRMLIPAPWIIIPWVPDPARTTTIRNFGSPHQVRHHISNWRIENQKGKAERDSIDTCLNVDEHLGEIDRQEVKLGLPSAAESSPWWRGRSRCGDRGY